MLVISPDSSLKFISYDRKELMTTTRLSAKEEFIVRGNAYLPKFNAPPPRNVQVHMRFMMLQDPSLPVYSALPMNTEAEFLRKHHMCFKPLKDVLPAELRGDVGLCMLEGCGTSDQKSPVLLSIMSANRALIGEWNNRPIFTTPSEHMQFIKEWLKVNNKVEHELGVGIGRLLKLPVPIQFGHIEGKFSASGLPGCTSVEPVCIDLLSCFKCGEPVLEETRLNCLDCGNAAFCAGCKTGEHGCTGYRVSASRAANLNNMNNIPLCASPGCDKTGTGANSLKNCSGCKNAMYCSVTCQRSHWKEHKVSCRK